MIVEVRAGVRLREPENFRRFHVEAKSEGAAVDGLGPDGRASARPGHVFVRIGALEALAQGSVGPDWGEGFKKMIEFARGRGWLDEGETHILAHIEPPIPDQ